MDMIIQPVDSQPASMLIQAMAHSKTHPRPIQPSVGDVDLDYESGVDVGDCRPHQPEMGFRQRSVYVLRPLH